MKFSYKLSDAVHILVYLTVFATEDTSSKAIAQSINANPSVVRSLMSNLRKAGLISNRQGVAQAKLARTPEQINLRDVYYALTINHDLLHVDPDTNQKCPVGANIQATLTDIYANIQAQAEAKMAQITLAQIVAQLHAHAAKNVHE